MVVPFSEWLPDLLSLQLFAQNSIDQGAPHIAHNIAISCESFSAPKPESFEKVSLSIIRSNLAAIPVDWTSQGVGDPWTSFQIQDAVMEECIDSVTKASFLAFDSVFLDIIGPDAKLEMIHDFHGSDAHHVHEAPAFVPSTNELVFADTSVVGWLWALESETHQIRKINTKPPLKNVNGATMYESQLYFTTNGGSSPAVWECSMPVGSANTHTQRPNENDQDNLDLDAETISCDVVVNNYRLKHLNSPNDLIFTSTGNILFTDPIYGWMQSWPGVNAPELPTAIYHFNTKTHALVALDNDQVLQPNGLALSANEKTLYVADSNSTSSKPLQAWDHSVRNVYAFDFDEAKLLLGHKRLVHMVESGWPDGLRVTKAKTSKGDKELVLVAGMGGVDVVDVSAGGAGILLGKWNVGDDIIFNLEPTNDKAKQGEGSMAGASWFLTGKKGIYKVSFSSTS